MQAIMETIFDIFYLSSVMLMGILLIKYSRGNNQFKLFGIMALILGIGDAFHLVPRVIALWTSGLQNYTAPLGIGKLITSITMTIFYVMLYFIWKIRYQIKGKNSVTIIVFILAAIRITLCLFPQNGWTSENPSQVWGIYRNIPLVILGIIIILLFYTFSKIQKDESFKWMWLAILLSFLFYIPVVLWADKYPLVGMFMIPKTLAYLWCIWMGYDEMKNHNKVIVR